MANKKILNTKKPVKRGKNTAKDVPFEQKPELIKLFLYIVIVDTPIARNVEKLFQNFGSSAQFSHVGRGTASKEILNIMGVSDNQKTIINAIIGEDKLENIERELNIYFTANKKYRGMGFSIPFSSIEGIRMYKYLTQSL